MSLFISPRLKLERAYQHVKEIEKLTIPLSKELYEIKIESEFSFPKPYAVGMNLVYIPLKPISETLGLVIGDAINNFRSSLDHLASGLIKAQAPNNRPYFPMAETRDELMDNRFLKQLEKSLPGSFDLLINKLRPASHCNDIYWKFHLLDNDSKHNIILPTISNVNVENINVQCGGARLTNCRVGGDATKRMIIIHSSGAEIIIHNDFEVYVDLRFPLHSKFSTLDVISTLKNIGLTVRETIDQFEKLYVKNKHN
ncbi:hypothetical protein [Pseudaeromonas paramecii]|uniref:TIGR04255 family protein n=1 Tax=Pseudaeromonas paramecii TaxID=2138166 RepID=A0ABP8PUY2_9GAMM